MPRHRHARAPLADHPNQEAYVAAIAEMKLPPLMRPARVAALLDLTTRRVYDLVANGDLAAVRQGVRGVRIFRDSLIDFLRQGGSEGLSGSGSQDSLRQSAPNDDNPAP